MRDFWNQWPEVIFGREGEEDNEGDNNEGDLDDDSNDDDGNDDNDKSGQSTGRTDSDFENLQKALKAERRENAKNARELKKLQQAQGNKDQKEQSDLDAAKNELQETKARTEKLAAGLLKRDIDSKIRAAARELKFLDIEDALNGVDRSKIAFDQDPDDPTDIDIDEDSVNSVVKALATKKPHFLSRGTEDGEPTGSTMGGSRKKKKSTEETYKEHYPSL